MHKENVNSLIDCELKVSRVPYFNGGILVFLVLISSRYLTKNILLSIFHSAASLDP